MSIFVISTTLFAQEGSVSQTKKDELSSESGGLTKKLDLKLPFMKKEQKPQLSFFTGFANFSRNDLEGAMSPIQMYGASVGTNSIIRPTKERNIIEQEYSGFTFLVGGATEVVHYANSMLGSKNAINTTQFGFEQTSGYGYDLGSDIDLMLLVSDYATWTSIRPQTFSDQFTQDNWQRIDDFSGSLRYGSTMAPTVEVKAGDHFSVKASYSWTQVLPRHMFWYWAGSEMIEGIAARIAETVINGFGDKEISSKLIMHFVLQNAVAYGFKELRRKNMNWPFDTVAPMNITSWNIGLSYTF